MSYILIAVSADWDKTAVIKRALLHLTPSAGGDETLVVGSLSESDGVLFLTFRELPCARDELLSAYSHAATYSIEKAFYPCWNNETIREIFRYGTETTKVSSAYSHSVYLFRG